MPAKGMYLLTTPAKRGVYRSKSNRRNFSWSLNQAIAYTNTCCNKPFPEVLL